MNQPETPKLKVFVSYASENLDRVGELIEALRSERIEPIWDQVLNPGDNFRQKIDAMLTECRVAVVCWSPDAAVSEWVISEADDARKQRKIVPVLLEVCKVPKPFDQLQTTDLRNWCGNVADPAFQTLVEAIRAKAAGKEPDRRAWRARLFTAGGVGVMIAGALTIAIKFGDLKDLYDGFANPGATQAQVAATEGKVDKILALMEAGFGQPFDPASQTALRQSIADVLSAQDDLRRAAAHKLESGDRNGALNELLAVARETEKATAQLYEQVGALSFPDRTKQAIDAYSKSVELAPENAASRVQLGILLQRIGQLDEAKAQFGQVRDRAGTKDPVWQAEALRHLGNIAFVQANLNEAQQRYLESYAIEKSLNRRQASTANVLNNLGNVLAKQGDDAAAEKFYVEAKAINTALGSTQGLAHNLNNLGLLAQRRGDFVAAADFHQRALKLHEAGGSLEGQAINLENLGLVAEQEHRPSEARELYSKALQLSREVGSAAGVQSALSNLGLLEEGQGNLVKARTSFEEALRSATADGITSGIVAQRSNLDRIAGKELQRANLPLAKKKPAPAGPGMEKPKTDPMPPVTLAEQESSPTSSSPASPTGSEPAPSSREQAFSKADANGDGALSLAEVKLVDANVTQVDFDNYKAVRSLQDRQRMELGIGPTERLLAQSSDDQGATKKE